MSMFKGIYKTDGPDKHLVLKGALLREDPDDLNSYLAQFDDLCLKEAFGWHRFKKEAFEVEYNFDTF